MAHMKDTEGVAVPGHGVDGRPLFDVDLCDFNEGAGPELTLTAPAYTSESGDYPGGVLFVPLRSVLEKYLLEIRKIDGAEGRDAFVAWLRDYADRLEKA